MSPANTKPVAPFTAARHLDLQADLHYACDWFFQGKQVLDVGAGLGRSKARMRHNRVTTYEPSAACRGLVDRDTLPSEPFEVVTAFEVLEHVADDHGFLRLLDGLASQAVFLTTPNWDVARCQSADHYREYTQVEFLTVLRHVWPEAPVFLLAYYKDAEGGWVEQATVAPHPVLKHVAVIVKALPPQDLDRLVACLADPEARAAQRALQAAGPQGTTA